MDNRTDSAKGGEWVIVAESGKEEKPRNMIARIRMLIL